MKKPLYKRLFRLYWTIINSYLVEAAGIEFKMQTID